VLNGPRGVTVDNNYNVYVTSYRSNSIVVVEPDGRQGRELISSYAQLFPFYRVACDGTIVIVYVIYVVSTCCYVGQR
jgi:streptogramin lyase